MRKEDIIRYDDKDLEKRLKAMEEEKDFILEEIKRREKLKIERKLQSAKDALSDIIKTYKFRLRFNDSFSDNYDSFETEMSFKITIENGYLVLDVDEN